MNGSVYKKYIALVALLEYCSKCDVSPESENSYVFLHPLVAALLKYVKLI